MIEREYKFRVKDPGKLMKKLGVFDIAYVVDEIWGNGSKSKIRLRTCNGFIDNIEKTTPMKNDGANRKLEERLAKIPKGWKLENSYDKVRYHFANGVSLDFTTIGCFLEIEGNNIEYLAKKLGFNPKDNITKTYDELFCEGKKNPPLHWGFRKI